ncbi:MAG: TetR/AcrR family transcriptional regulator [Planctomycetaceae bacterium]|nr:TetR/AcrR family transcriptional regulator [Planctomycetaceae bacterium]
MSTGKKTGGSREAVLRAALRVISRLGYADTSVGDIAAEAGVNNVTAYRLFENKENLFRQVIEAFSDVDFDEETVKTKAGAPLTSLFADLASAYFAVIFRNIHIIRIFIVEALHFDFVRRRAWYMPPAILRHCRKMFGALEGAAEIDEAEVERAAEMFVSQVVRRALEYNKHDDLWEYGPELAASFKKGMRPQIELLARLLPLPLGARVER